MPPGHDRLLGDRIGASSGSGDDDDPAAIGQPGDIAIEQPGQFYIGIGQRRFFAALRN